MVYAQPRIHPGKWDVQTSQDVLHTNGSPNPCQTTRPYNNKKEGTCRVVDFVVPVDHRVKLKECEKRDKYLDLVRELKKTVEHKIEGFTNYNWCSWYSQWMISTRTGGLRNHGTGGEYPNDSIIEIGQNPEKSPGVLWRFAAFKLQWKLSSNADVKNSRSKIIKGTWKWLWYQL